MSAAALALPIKNTFVHFVHFPAEVDGSPMAEMDGSPVKVRSRRARSEGRKSKRSSPGSAEGDGHTPMWGDLEIVVASPDSTSDDEDGSQCGKFDRADSEGGSTASNCNGWEVQLARQLAAVLDSTPEWSSESDGGSESEPLGRFRQLTPPVPDSAWARVPPRHVAAPLKSLDLDLSRDPAYIPLTIPAGASETGATIPLPSAGAGKLANAVWTVQEEEVNSERNKICSGQFFVPIPGHGPCPFEVILYAEDRMNKGASCEAQGFQRSRGRGRLEVRCQEKLTPGKGSISVDLSIGSGRPQASRRGPVTHDFSKQACFGWRHVDFRSAVDPATHALQVSADFSLPQ